MLKQKLSAYGRLMRGRHWAKNLLVLLPVCIEPWPLAPGSLAGACLAALTFALASSAVYCVNDVADKDSDMRHPKKQARPVASGEVRPAEALVLAAGLACAALAPWIRTGKTSMAAIIATYLALNALYSAGLKRVPYLDVAVLSFGFPMRLAAGAIAISAAPQPLLYTSVQAFALYLTFGKRRNELIHAGRSFRPSLRACTQDSLAACMLASIAAANICYAAWCVAHSLGTGKDPAALAVTEVLMLALSVKFHKAQLARRDDGDMLVAMLSDPRVVIAIAALVLGAILAIHI